MGGVSQVAGLVMNIDLDESKFDASVNKAVAASRKFDDAMQQNVIEKCRKAGEAIGLAGDDLTEFVSGMLRASDKLRGSVNSAFNEFGSKTLSSVSDELRRLEQQFKLCQQGFQSGEATLKEQINIYQNYKAQVSSVRAEMEKLQFGTRSNSEASKAAAAEVQRLANAYANLGIQSKAAITTQVGQLKSDFSLAYKSTGGDTGEQARLTDAYMQKLSGLRAQLTGASKDTDEMNTRSRNLHGTFDILKNNVEGTGTSWKSFSYSLREALTYVAAAYVAFQGMKAVLSELWQTGTQVQQLELAFQAITGSARNAAKELDWLRETSNKMGVDFYKAADGFKSLSVAAMGTSLEGEKVHKVYQSIVTAGTAVGLSSEQIKGALYAVEQMVSKGSVSMEELRRQLGNQLPGAFQIAAQAMGVTTAELGKMVKTGTLAADDFLPKFADALQNRFAGVAVQAADTAARAADRFSTAWKDLVALVGNSGFLDGAKAALDELSKLMKSEEVKQWAVNFGAAMKDLLPAIAEVVKVLATIFTSVSNGWSSLPAIIQEMGIIAALFGGTEFKIAVVGIGIAIDWLGKLFEVSRKVFTAIKQGFIDAFSVTPDDAKLSKDAQRKVDDAKARGKSLNNAPKDFELGIDETKEQAATRREINLQQQKLENVRDQKAAVTELAELKAKLYPQEANALSMELSYSDKLAQAHKEAISVADDQADKAIAQVGEQETKWNKYAKQREAEYAKGYKNIVTLQKLLDDGNLSEEKRVQVVAASSRAYEDLKDKIDEINAAENKKGANEANKAARADISAGKVYSDAWNDLAKAVDLAEGDNTGAKIAEINKKLADQLAVIAKMKVAFAGSADAMWQLNQAEEMDKAAAKILEKNAIQEQYVKSLEKEQKQIELNGKYGSYEDKDYAERYKIFLAYQQALNTAKGNQLAIDQASVFYAKELEGYEVKKAALKAKNMADYSTLMGNARKSLQYQIQELELSKEKNKSQAELLVIQEKINRLQAKANMNVSALMDNGLKDYAIKTYNELADKIGSAIPNALDTLSTSISSNLTDMITGAKTVGQAFADMGTTMQKALLQCVIDIGILIMKMQLLRLLGYDTQNAVGGISVNSSGGTSLTGSGSGSGSSGGISDLLTNSAGSYLKDKVMGGNSMFSGISSSVDQFAGQGLFGLGNSTGIASSAATSATSGGAQAAMGVANGVSGSGAATTGASGAAAAGGMSVLGGAAAGIGLGGSLGSMIYSNGTGTLGAWGGAVGGAALGTAIFPGVGTLIGGIIGGLAGGGLTGSSTTTHSSTGSSGITVNMTMAGDTSYTGWEGMRSVTSGAFGSQSTKHYKNITAADPALVKEWTTGMDSVYDALTSASKSLMMSLDPIINFTFPLAFDVNSTNMSQAITNISEAMAESTITASGLKSEFDKYRQDGEYYVDELKRLGTAYETASYYADAAGLSMEGLTNSLSKIEQAARASELIDAVGGTSNFQSAMSRYQKYTMSSADAAQATFEAAASKAGQYIAYIGDSSVSLSNFWSKYQEAWSTMTPDKFKVWNDASVWVDQTYQAMENTNSSYSARITLLQNENSTLQTNASALKEVADAWKTIVDKLKDAIEAIKFDSNLTSLSPTDVYTQQRAKLASLGAAAKGGDKEAADEIADFSKTFLTTSKSYYGASEQYYADYAYTQQMLTDSLGVAQGQLDYAAAAYNSALQQIAQNEAMIAQLTLANQNLGVLGNGLDSLASAMHSSGSVGSAIAAANNAQAAASASIASNPAPSAPASDPWADLMAQIAAAMNPTTDSVWGTAGDMSGYATGGNFGPGLAMVGEDGPEIVRFGAAGQVFTASDTAQMINGSSGNTDVVAGLRQVNSTSAYGLSAVEKAVKDNTKQNKRLERSLSRAGSAPRG